MAYKFEIVNNSLVVTNTTENKVILDQPKQNIYYNVKYLLLDSLIVLHDTQAIHKEQRALLPIGLANAVDSTNTPFTLNSFIDFCRGNLGFAISTGGSTPSYTEVNTFADLPPAGDHTGETYHVINSTGSWILFNRKQSGLYRSNGSEWLLRNDISSLLVDNEFNIRDDADNTKGIRFVLDDISTGVIRAFTFPDKDGVIATLDDLEGSIVITNMTTNTVIPLISTLNSEKLYRYVNRTGSSLTLTTSGSDLLEGESSQTIFDGETFDLTIDGNNFRI